MAGHVYKTGKNSYRIAFMFEGVRYRENIKASSDTEANNKLILFVADIMKRNYRNKENITFLELSQLFMDKHAILNLSASTIDDYECRLNKYILSYFGHMKLYQIKRFHIQEFATFLLKEYNLSSKSIKNYIGLISSILSFAIFDLEVLENNVTNRVKIPKNIEKMSIKYKNYSYNELKLFFKYLEKNKDEQFKIAVYSFFYTGARRGEVIALKWKHIDFKTGCINITDNRIKVKGGTLVKDTKTGKERTIYVPRGYIDKIKEYYKYSGSPDKNTFIFTMHPSTYSNKFKKFLENHQCLRKITIKSLRALNESILLDKGIDIIAAAERLGHNPETAKRHYLDTIPRRREKGNGNIRKHYIKIGAILGQFIIIFKVLYRFIRIYNSFKIICISI